MKLLAASVFASIFLASLCQNLSPVDLYRHYKLSAVAGTLSSECKANVMRCIGEYSSNHQQEAINYCDATRSSQSCALKEVTVDGKRAVCNSEEYAKLEAAGCTCKEEAEAFNDLVEASENLESQGIPQICLDKASSCNNDKLPSFAYLRPYCDFITQQESCLRSNESCTEETYNNWQQHTCKQYCSNDGIRETHFSLSLMILMAALYIFLM